MLDQATELRKLVLRSVREPLADGSPAPLLLVVCGGHSGVGVTTLSVHLAIALSGQGCRVVLVDADLHQPGVAPACGLSGDAGIAEVLAARRDIHEVLQPGPGGVQVVAGYASAGHPADWGEVAQQRLLRQLKKLGRHADLIALDAGSGGHEVLRRFWRAADEVVLVTTPDTQAVMEAYAAIKRLAGANPAAVLRLLVNRAADPSVGKDVHQRICEASERFLELALGLLGSVPHDPAFDRTGHPGTVRAMRDGDTPASLALDAVAAQLIASRQRPVSVARPRGPAAAEVRNSADLAQPQPRFSPIDV
jgi:flagellar biosynthesis protein FlhG